MLTQLEHELADLRGLTGEVHQTTRDVLERVREARAELAPLPPVIAFVHIPKTAGATVKSMLANAYGKDAIRDAGNYLKRSEGTMTRVATPPRGDWTAWIRAGGRVTVGHTPYGLFRQHLPPDTRYITFLRDPVERVLSHYHRHIQSTGPPTDQTKEERGAVVAASIEEALEMNLPELSNLATRFLCNFPSPPGSLPPSALDEAKANLTDFTFVGIQEQFEESVVLLQRRFGLGLVTYINRHVSIDRPTSEEISPEQRELIAEHNRLDLELYGFARGLFEDAVAHAGDGFAVDVETLGAESAVANEAAIRRACDWLLRELPDDTSRPKNEMLADAGRAGVAGSALKEVVMRLPVTRFRGEDGQVMWSLTDHARGHASRAELQYDRRQAPDEETLQRALDWLNRELPAGSSMPKEALKAKARQSGVSVPAVKHWVNRLSVRKEPDDDGEMIWSRPA